jgi:hypothetical protein
MRYRLLIPITLLAAFANILPLLLVVPAGDAILNYMQIECFSKQLWSGIFYPRWCMDANAGLGSPAPIFYFPLPFYLTALFAPLKAFGLTTDTQYLLGVYTANATAFLCCYAWISRLVKPRTAAFCAFIFLFGFYRGEIIARSSYAEYWCVAFLPLLFAYTRDACHNFPHTGKKLAAIITVCMLCHAPVTVIGLMAAGLYMLMMNWRAIPRLLLATFIAAILTLPHYLPMMMLTPTLNPEMGGVNHWQRSWLNSFISTIMTQPEHEWVLIGAAIGFIVSFSLFIIVWRKLHLLPPEAQREGICWIAIATFACFMMFPISAPLWNLIKTISSVATPWRMQGLMMFALILNFALLAEYAWFQNAKTRTGDRLIASLFFIFCFLFYSGGVAEDSLEMNKKLLPSQFSTIYFGTRDMDARYIDADLFFADFVYPPKPAQAEWVRGAGTITITQWNERGILITGHANSASTLRLWHSYYPIWQASMGGKSLTLRPEPITGRILADIPKGDFTLELRMNYWHVILGLDPRIHSLVR